MLHWPWEAPLVCLQLRDPSKLHRLHLQLRHSLLLSQWQELHAPLHESYLDRDQNQPLLVVLIQPEKRP